MGKRELVTLLNLSSWCLVMVEWLLLDVPWGCLPFVIVEFPDHNRLLFLKSGNPNDRKKYKLLRNKVNIKKHAKESFYIYLNYCFRFL